MSKNKWIISGVCLVIVVLLIVTAVASTAPRDFPNGIRVEIKNGQTLTEAADTLVKAGVIRSATLFKAFAIILDKTSGIRTGEYLFSQAESVVKVAMRLVSGQEGFPVKKITIPEGSTSSEISAIIGRALPSFKTKDFLLLAKADEGYLFPETYFWNSNVAPEKVVADMKATFDAKVKPLLPDIASSTRTLGQIVTMASIIEREATSSTDRQIIAGILWKRFDAGMALQVDAPFYYILNKPSSQLTLDDLKVDSAYNLYTHVGLTPKPISNPGLEAITDTLKPVKTKYWYYLSDAKGGMHYAATLEDHAYNKNRYLR